jgi:hypothetical protein
VGTREAASRAPSATVEALGVDVRALPASRLAEVVAVGALLLPAVAVRAWGLPGDGPVAYDEGWSLSNGRFLVAVLTHPRQWMQLHGHGHVFLFGLDWKVGYDVVLGSLLAAGVAPQNLTWLSALAGFVMVMALAALAGRRWGAPAAAVAGVFTGAAPLSIVYGHRILSEAACLAVLALVLLLLDRWWDGRPSRALGSLTVAAIAATLSLNYRLLPTLLPIVLVVVGLAWWYRRHDLPPIPPTGRLVLLCLLPTVAIVAIYLLIGGAGAVGLPHLPALVNRQFIRSGGGVPLPFASPDFYPRTLWEFGGPALVVAAGLGLVACLWIWKRLDPLTALAVGSLAGILLFFSAAHDKAPRAIAVCIPFAALVVARGVMVPKRPALQWTAALALCATCLAVGWTESSFARDPSGTAQAGTWLAARPGAIVTTRGPVYAALTEQRWDVAGGLDPAHRIVVPLGDSTIASLRHDGARWVVVDAHALLTSPSRIFQQLLACGRSAAEFDDPADWSRLQFLEEADSLHAGYDAVLERREQLLRASQGREIIRIYDLEGPGTASCA